MNTLKLLPFLFLFTVVIQIRAQKYLSGYNNTVKGEIILYHSPQPDAERALLIRSEDSTRYIEWMTEKIPMDYDGKTVRFLMLAGIDVNPENPHKWNVSINGVNCITINTPLDARQKKLSWIGKNNSMLSFTVQSIDRHGDLMGYLILELPTGEYKGKALKIRITGENANSKTWFMVFEYPIERKIKLFAEPAIIKGDKENFQALRLDITHFEPSCEAEIYIGKHKIRKTLNFGFNRIYLQVPVISEAKQEKVLIKAGNKYIGDETFYLKPVTTKTIYLLHHSHVDIGYTHVQDEVEKLQWSFLEQAIELARNSNDYPPGSKFKWNVEVMWAVDSYLKKAKPEQQKQFIEAVRNGWIGLQGLYANELTALCNTRELVELTESARRIAKVCGVTVESAMISDIPGWTWGLVTVLAKSGIKYMSLGTNQGHRIGDMIEKWGDKPFYWVSQSGHEKILCWVHQLGYSSFHTGLGYLNLQKVLSEDKIFAYLNHAIETDYPYDILMLRYNIGSDNGPTDNTLSIAVKEWNEKYISPKIVISTTTEAFRKFEEIYGKEIPSVRGDLTGYWEDGAASSARETGINRKTADLLSQLETLYALIKPGSFIKDEFNKAWQKVLLYDEHTWGSWNSISEPFAEFTKQQWIVKKSFAENASKETVGLWDKILKERKTEKKTNVVEVFNTLSWKRSGLVFLPTGIIANSVSNNKEEYSPLQRLTDGRSVFYAKDIPAFGSMKFILHNDSISSNKIACYSGTYLKTGHFNLDIDQKSGAIKILEYAGVNFSDTAAQMGLNQYFYVKGRNPENKSGIVNTKVSLKEKGPVINSLLIESDAPGCKWIKREIQLVEEPGYVQIVNTIDKDEVLEPEGLHFAFPFHVPDGEIRYDLAFSQVKVQADQLPGSCRNYITVENFIDISNHEFGITLAAIDAPLFEIGNISTDATAFGWIKQLESSQTVFSYIMNNYWETNYRAAQEGITTFNYVLKPHKRYNSLEAEKFGMEQRQLLIPVLGSDSECFPPFELSDNGIIGMGLLPVENGLLLTVFNAGGKPETLKWNKAPGEIYESNFDGEKLQKINGDIEIAAFGVLNLYIPVN